MDVVGARGVAYQLIDAWADGHQMPAWIALWLICFAAVTTFASRARQSSATVVGIFDAWSRRIAKSKADERRWALANTDPRVTAELRAASAHREL